MPHTTASTRARTRAAARRPRAYKGAHRVIREWYGESVHRVLRSYNRVNRNNWKCGCAVSKGLREALSGTPLSELGKTARTAMRAFATHGLRLVDCETAVRDRASRVETHIDALVENDEGSVFVVEIKVAAAATWAKSAGGTFLLGGTRVPASPHAYAFVQAAIGYVLYRIQTPRADESVRALVLHIYPRKGAVMGWKIHREPAWFRRAVESVALNLRGA